MEEQDKKISLPEIIIGTLINGSLDFGEFIAGFFLAIPVIGQIVMAFMFLAKGFVWLIMQFWLIMKGIKGFWFLGGNLLELLPFADMLPARTATWLATCFMANNPKVASLAKKTVSLKTGLVSSGQQEDALLKLNAKENRTREENIRLVKARQIMERGSIDVNETDPVLRAAFERAQRGERVYDGTYENRDGFRFSNVQQW